MPTYLIPGLLAAALVAGPVQSSASGPPQPSTAPDQARSAVDSSGAPSGVAASPSGPKLDVKGREAWRWRGFLEADLGVLLMSGGTGLFAGPAYGPFRAAVGFYRFDSPSKALGGVPDGFELKVNWLLSVDAAYFIAQDGVGGPYVRVAYQEKEQRVLNLSNGARTFLRSRLAGPEVGYVWNFGSGFYVAPRLGGLYYLRSPQPGGAPILVGGRSYDNERHKRWDLFATVGLGVQL
jgi:hypothetical protein